MNRRWILLTGFVASLLAVGAFYWPIPYGRVNLPDALYGPALALVALAAAVATGTSATGFWKAVGVIGSSVGAAVMLRVIVETAIDPTRHNLWPFELVIALTVGLICALAGASLGYFFSRMRGT